jgi:hypothetical protein
MKKKRIIITTLLGLICGCISWAVCKYGMGHSQPISVNLVIVLFNGLMGFTIGISALRWHWVLHGLVLGGLFGFILGLIALGHGDVFIWPLVMGFAYGFVIELVTTLGFKAGIADSGSTE